MVVDGAAAGRIFWLQRMNMAYVCMLEGWAQTIGTIAMLRAQHAGFIRCVRA